MSSEDSIDTPHYPGPRKDAPESWGEMKAKEVSWYWAGGALGIDPATPGIDYVRGMIAGRYPPPPMASLIPTRIISVADGEVVLRCLPDESLLNTNGTVHGGVLATLMDTAMGVAVISQVLVSQPHATIEMKISYLKPMAYDGQEVEVVGKTLRVGRKVAFAEARAFNSSGALIGHATSSLARVAG